MRQLPSTDFTYSGLTIVLDKPSRFDKPCVENGIVVEGGTDLLNGFAGQYFDACLTSAGNPQIHRKTIEIRTMADRDIPFLPNTKALLLLGEETCRYYTRHLNTNVILDEQRGSPFLYEGLPAITTYAPQDAYDRRDYFSEDGDEGEGDEDDGEAAEGKTTHGATQRKNWRFWMRQDIKKAVRLTTQPLDIPSPTYHLWPDINEVIHLLTTTKGKDFFFDIETDRNLQMTCFGFSFGLPDIYVVPMLQTHLNPQRYYYEKTYLLLRALSVCLRDNTVVIHNSSFDLFALAWRYGICPSGPVFDTMLAHNRCAPGYETVDTVSGRIKIEELFGKKDFHVWSWKDGQPYPAKVKQVIKTRLNTELVRVHFWKRKFGGVEYDHIDCTPDHKFLVDNKWIEAKDLVAGTKLTRVNIAYSENYDTINVHGFSEKAHRYIYEKLYGLIDDPEIDIHHKDNNTHNNEPDNLQPKKHTEHTGLHSAIRTHLQEHTKQYGPWNRNNLGGHEVSRELIEQMYSSGMSQLEIASELDCDQANVCRLMKNFKIPKRTLKEAQQLRRQKQSNCRVVKVEKLEQREDTYCLEVEDTHCYSCHGVIIHNCYIEVEKSLGHCISFYSDLPYHKNEGIFEPHNHSQAQQLYEYNGKDILGLIQIKPKIVETALRLGATESVEQVNRMVIPYLTMTLQGIRLDVEKIDKIISYHTRWNIQLLRVLAICCGHEINPNSWQQVSKYLYEELGIKKPDKDPTAEKTLLQLLLKSDVPPIHAILKYRGNQKRISKASLKSKKGEPRFYYGLFNNEKEVPRITTSWRLGKTVTMRLGSSKLLRRWGDNLQNWEKELRKVICADAGKVLLQIDQSGAEALIVAYLCRPGQLRDLFLCGINPHCFLGLHLFKKQFEAVLGYSLSDMVILTVKQLAQHPKWKDVSKVIKDSDGWESDRRYYFIAKQGNHSLNYDAKARAFRLNTLLKSEGAVALTMEEAQNVIDTRSRLFPELPFWWSETIQEAKRTNILRNLFGHPRVITQRIEEGMYKELYAFKSQSTVGQITNYAITEFQERIQMDDEILCTASTDVLQNNHDSMLVQCLPEHATVVGKEMVKHFNRCLVSPRGENFNMKSEIQIGETWGDMKTLDLN